MRTFGACGGGEGANAPSAPPLLVTGLTDDLHQSNKEMLPWYLAHDHVNYARYLPVYLIHMILLPDTHPEAHPLECRELITKQGFAQLPFD